MQPRESYHERMGQLSIRLDDELHRRARLAAQHSGSSLNGYIARVLTAAVDPAADEPELDRIRARLAAAGLLDSPVAPTPALRPDADEQRFREARTRTRGGTPASALIAEERRAGR